jgi:hypothetical protein
MKIVQYVAGLLPSFQRSKVEIDAQQQQDILKRYLLPSLKKAAELMAGRPFSTELARPVEEAIRRVSGVHSGNVNMVSILLTMYQALSQKLEFVAKIIESEFEQDLSRDDMTYKQLQLIRYLELSRFSMEYTFRLVSRLLAAEARVRLNQPERIDEQLTPAEIKWMEQNLATYIQVLALLHIPTIQMRTAIQNMPEVTIVPASADATAATVGLHRLDPLRMNFINTNALSYNPIYHIRLMKSEMEVEHLKLLEKESMALELRLLELRNAYADRQDARVEQQIVYREGQLSRLRTEYHALTTEYGLA